MIVHLLTIEHRHGTDHWVCATEEIATQVLDNYVQEWWDDLEAYIESGGPMPENRDSRIKRYFDVMGDLVAHSEHYEIKQLEVIE